VGAGRSWSTGVSCHALCRQARCRFLVDRANATRFNVAEKYFDEAAKTVKPYLDAGKVKSFSGKTALLPGITAHPTPGHTPGHSCYGGKQGASSFGRYCSLCFGAISQPEITVAYDVDANAAAAQRKTG